MNKTSLAWILGILAVLSKLFLDKDRFNTILPGYLKKSRGVAGDEDGYRFAPTSALPGQELPAMTVHDPTDRLLKTRALKNRILELEVKYEQQGQDYEAKLAAERKKLVQQQQHYEAELAAERKKHEHLQKIVELKHALQTFRVKDVSALGKQERASLDENGVYYAHGSAVVHLVNARTKNMLGGVCDVDGKVYMPRAVRVPREALERVDLSDEEFKAIPANKADYYSQSVSPHAPFWIQPLRAEKFQFQDKVSACEYTAIKKERVKDKKLQADHTISVNLAMQATHNVFGTSLNWAEDERKAHEQLSIWLNSKENCSMIMPYINQSVRKRMEGKGFCALQMSKSEPGRHAALFATIINEETKKGGKLQSFRGELDGKKIAEKERKKIESSLKALKKMKPTNKRFDDVRKEIIRLTEKIYF